MINHLTNRCQFTRKASKKTDIGNNSLRWKENHRSKLATFELLLLNRGYSNGNVGQQQQESIWITATVTLINNLAIQNRNGENDVVAFFPTFFPSEEGCCVGALSCVVGDCCAFPLLSPRCVMALHLVSSCGIWPIGRGMKYTPSESHTHTHTL